MGNLRRSSSFVIYITLFQILGLFPYTWNTSLKNNSGTKRLKVFKTSHLLQINVFVTIITGVFQISCCFGNFAVYNENFKSSKTLLIALYIYQVARTATNASYLLSQLANRRTFRVLLEKAYWYFQKFNIPEKSDNYRNFSELLLSLFLVSLVGVFWFFTAKVEISFFTLSFIGDLIIQMLAVIFIQFQFIICDFSSSLIEKSFEPITIKLVQKIQRKIVAPWAGPPKVINDKIVTLKDIHVVEKKLLKAIHFTNKHLRVIEAMSLTAISSAICSIILTIFCFILSYDIFSTFSVEICLLFTYTILNLLILNRLLAMRMKQMNSVSSSL